MTCEADPLDFGCFTKRPSDVFKVKFDFATTLSKYIESGKLYRAGDYLLPRIATGFAYRVLADGNAGPKEPTWPTKTDIEIISGSLRMVSVPALYNGIDIITNATSSVAVVSNESAIPDLSVLVNSWEGPEAEIIVSSGTLATDYLIELRITTMSSQVLNGIALCSVRNKQISICDYN